MLPLARRTLIEQETIISFNEGEKTAHVYTFNKPLQHKLVKLAEDYPSDCYLDDAYTPDEAVEYIVPKKWIKINAPHKMKPLTEEEKAIRSERMKAVVEARKAKKVVG